VKRPLLPLTILALCTSSALAQPEAAARAFSGRVEAGAVFISSTDQLFAHGERQIDDLDGSADRSGAVLPVALFDLRYRSEASGTEVFLGTPLEKDAVRLTLGVGHTWEGVGTLELAAIANPWAQVWDDPYRVGGERDAVWSREYGGRLGCQGIAGTGTEIAYTALHTDVDHDEAGDRFGVLRRSGWTHQLELGYGVPVLPGVLITPSIAALFGDLRGDAEAYRGYEGKVSALLVRERAMVKLFASAGHTRYRGEHPLFVERRRETSFGGGAMVTFPGLFGMPHLFADVVAGYGVRDSNLGFFDANTTMGAVARGYQV